MTVDIQNFVTQFYDELAPYHHLIFANWEDSIARQATILDRLIRQEWGDHTTSVLDVSCGIGTQALGLAQHGYQVTASDLSPQAIARARIEAEKRGLQIKLSIADMRHAFTLHQCEFDVVISCDNSIPHLLCDHDILEAFNSFHRCVKPGGGCLITMRDYDQEERSGVQIKPYGLRYEGNVKYFLFQVWEFKGEIYDLTMYYVQDEGRSEGTTKIFRSKYYAISPKRMMELLQEAGFQRVHKVESDFYQPVIVGSK